jgi:hypothetical protein
LLNSLKTYKNKSTRFINQLKLLKINMDCEELKKRTVVGLTEPVTIIGESEEFNVVARIDSGATFSSIDKAIFEKLKLGPIIK